MQKVSRTKRENDGAESTDFDVIVVGGGPAGMMAAGTAAQNGARVLLLEKNSSLGKKLLLTGNGRCNVTQNETDIRALVKKYGPNGPFLFSSFNAFGPTAAMEFFESLGVRLKTEELGRVFPRSDKAEDVRKALESWLSKVGVNVRFSATVGGLAVESGRAVGVVVGKTTVHAKQVIVTTGGVSYSSTGSSGDMFAWAKEIGIDVVEPVPALVPLKVEEKDVGDLKGLSLSQVGVSAAGNEAVGDMIFTHFGVSGPAVFVVSRAVSRALSQGHAVPFEVDVFPQMGATELEESLAHDFRTTPAKSVKHVLSEKIPSRLAEYVCRRAGVAVPTKAGQCTAKARRKLAETLKGLRFNVIDTLGWNAAMVTSGGIALEQVNPKTMESKALNGLYFAGEVLDLDGPTGGYNLQIAWSTGRAAGLAASVVISTKRSPA